MEASLARSHPLIVGAALAIILLCLAGAAAITGLLPVAVSQRSDSTAPAAGAVPACATCGTVVALRQVQVSGSASGAGAVAGGLTGAVVGSQFGRGADRTALTILGAAGGAYAGNSIEKNMNKSTAWRITIRMDDGSHRTLSQPEQPAVAVGDAVRIADGRALALPAGKR